METPKEWTKELAMEYFSIYAHFEKVPLEEGICNKWYKKILGDIGVAELEYHVEEKLFIVRGLINKDIGRLRNLTSK